MAHISADRITTVMKRRRRSEADVWNNIWTNVQSHLCISTSSDMILGADGDVTQNEAALDGSENEELRDACWRITPAGADLRPAVSASGWSLRPGWPSRCSRRPGGQTSAAAAGRPG